LIQFLFVIPIFTFNFENKSTFHMKSKNDIFQDINDIKEMMSKSSKFMSLSAISGVYVGIIALLGFSVSYLFADLSISNIKILVITGLFILLISLSVVFILSYKKAISRNENKISNALKILFIEFFLPLIVGGTIIVWSVMNNQVWLIIPVSLIFYGLGMYNISRLSLNELKYLGYSEILLGLLSLFIIQYSLIIWLLGFSLINIIFGLYLHNKYEK